MRVFMLASEPKAWLVTMNGPYVLIKNVGEIEMHKSEYEWENDDLEKIKINNKAINMLQCALNLMEFNRTFGCEIAKEIWDMLETTHEGNNQVKESKINRFIHMYKLFKMKPTECIADMYARFNKTITNLKAFRKAYLTSELVSKVLRCLPKSWEAKKTAIEEAKDLNLLNLDELIRSLMTHEIDLIGDEKVVKRTKNLAFKANESDDESNNEEDITKLVSRKVKKYMRKSLKRKSSKRNEEIHYFRRRVCSDDNDKEKPSKKHIKCYECIEMGYYRDECLKLKKGKKKKAFVAT
ncbi:hypothetical protein SLEP1_g9616 [Rubroshorea leprosula]|uniref:UBN2 domain-containing protein n=1 Tax=Rubroshorea leprosula TaxID=152421 RepID=A0AAV5IB60_9ROSI|nr:hypothetical protein SLEP1_g9616 [Rubroshorea leprosula]